MGIRLHASSRQAAACADRRFLAALASRGLAVCVEAGTDGDAAGFCGRYRLRDECAETWAPGRDTTRLHTALDLDAQARSADLEREILVALLASPLPFRFPSYDELCAAVRMRRHIVEAARRTALAFDTAHAERPRDWWDYAEGRGFTLKPGRELVAALIHTTQPDESGALFSFSCYRATEYIILLGIAQALGHCNPALLDRLQRQWRCRAIMSGEFHEVFLNEYGSLEAPLPPRYYVPGDRVWFRNPDAASADVAGYEGSWVFYLGGGLFSNFWKRNQPYTLLGKCVEIYHWRHGLCRGDDGAPRIDEAEVEARVAASLRDPDEAERILGLMMRYREPRGVYVAGGCIDVSRECPRRVCPGTAELVLPDA